ncbi:MAG: hypothetical protein JWN75_1131 [Candidatus Saccharibacteria bacterium]|jgi:hypothetical protein|nr:hypothetical protein [Candidatus Saccharibacteria bacterium]
MGNTTELRRELKRTFMPFLAAKGFTLNQRHAPHFIDFYRTVDERVQFLEIQWEKYGKPRFAVNVGQVSTKGTICYGEHIEAKDVGPGQAPQYCRVYPNGNGSSTRHWFRQDRPMISALLTRSRLYAPEVPIRQLLDLFNEIEEYWRSGQVGQHMFLTSNAWAKDAV